MIYISHRINTINELLTIPTEYGIEIDLRDYNNDIILSHDPFSIGDIFEDFLKYYKHKFIILNIKSERIEYKILDLLKKYYIKDYFFLDSSFPMIYNLSKNGEKNIALRFSEYESVESVLLMKDKIKWVWVDCFDSFPLTTEIYKIFKNNGLNICIVSPELQNQDDKIELYRDYMYNNNNIIPDMICTKNYNIDRWKEKFK